MLNTNAPSSAVSSRLIINPVRQSICGGQQSIRTTSIAFAHVRDTLAGLSVICNSPHGRDGLDLDALLTCCNSCAPFCKPLPYIHPRNASFARRHIYWQSQGCVHHCHAIIQSPRPSGPKSIFLLQHVLFFRMRFAIAVFHCCLLPNFSRICHCIASRYLTFTS